jgi:tetratricopeptide (TPR) repeat protein
MWRRDAAVLGTLAAIALAALLYAPVVGYELTHYDDAWLVRDNQVLRDADLGAVFFDLSRSTRFGLGAEYLPVRDLTVAADLHVWGAWWGGHHLTSLLVYLGAIGAFGAMLAAFGVPRWIAGVTVLLWATHPVHAESVAWLAERKGVLSALFVGISGWGYARWRAGGRLAWLIAAALAAVASVWSKAPAVFGVVALGAFELWLPERRVSARRSLVGLGVVALAAGLAFAPVLYTASGMSVVEVERDEATLSRPEKVVGVHGFYVRLAAISVPNAPRYPISVDGPSPLDLALGGLVLATALAVIAWPRRSPPLLRVAAALWLVWWFPSSHLALGLQNLVADRYLLMPVLGACLALAVALERVPRASVRYAALGVLVAMMAMRTLDARASWEDGRALWARAVAVSPHDGTAWAAYASALETAGDAEGAVAVAERGLELDPDNGRLLLRRGMQLYQAGRPDLAEPLLRRSADRGYARAMCNLALLLQDRDPDEARAWAERGAGTEPLLAHCHRTVGKLALAAGRAADALPAFEQARALEPTPANDFNLGLALTQLGRDADAIAPLERAARDPSLARQAEALLARIRR